MKKIILSVCLVAFTAVVSATIVNNNVTTSASNDANCASATYRGSCNVPSHKCSGYSPISGANHNCSNCNSHGYACHAVNHQPR